MNTGLRIAIRNLIFRCIGNVSFIRRIEWRRILQWLDVQPGERILDIACGGGELSLIIAGRGGEVHGIDISEKGIQSARLLSGYSGINGEFTVGDAEHLHYQNAIFDKVVCSSSLEHFRDDSTALREMERVLKPGGKIILTADSFTYPINPKLKDRHRIKCQVEHYYNRKQLEKSIRKAGLDVVRTEYLLNSFLTGFFFNIWIRFSSALVFWLIVSTIGYPLFLATDKFFGRPDAGYTLIAEARKKKTDNSTKNTGKHRSTPSE